MPLRHSVEVLLLKEEDETEGLPFAPIRYVEVFSLAMAMVVEMNGGLLARSEQSLSNGVR